MQFYMAGSRSSFGRIPSPSCMIGTTSLRSEPMNQLGWGSATSRAPGLK